MKGPFSMWTFFGLTLWIDIVTHLFVRKGRGRSGNTASFREVSVVIPAFKEEKYIEQTVRGAYSETYPVKNVIVCGDRFSARMREKAEGLMAEYPSLFYIESPYVSKAKKINYVVSAASGILGEFVYVRDARVYGSMTCIENMVSCFDSEKVAAVTSYGRLGIPKNYLSKSYHYGKAWINEIGKFRKTAQEKRGAVFVVCGASTMYRKKVLLAIPIPSKTKTEDTHYTWALQREGFSVRVAAESVASAPDVDGSGLKGIFGQARQAYRWSSGTLQCLYHEGRHFRHNKRLFLTTILPGFIESTMYSVMLILLPFLLLVSPVIVYGFLIGDVVFSLLGTLVLMPKKFLKTVVHYPQIALFKYVNAAVFVAAAILVAKDIFLGKSRGWSNEWVPPDSDTDLQSRNSRKNIRGWEHAVWQIRRPA